MSRDNYPLGRPPKKSKATVFDYRPGTRPCLGLDCGRMFASQGPGHRLCPACTKKRDHQLLSRTDINAAADARN